MPGYTNFIRYDRAYENRELISYYKGLIAFRKKHKSLCMAKAEDVRKGLRFVENLPEDVLAYTVTDGKETLFVAYNAGTEAVTLEVPETGNFKVCITGTRAGTESLGSISGKTEVPPKSALVAVKI
jgi:pullulanase